MNRGVYLMAFLASIVVANSQTSAQVAARQGSFDTSKQFTSPMVLAVSLPESLLKPLRAGSGPGGVPRSLVDPTLRQYSCDGVSIANLWVAAAPEPKDESSIALEFFGQVLVPESFDREVDLTLTVRRGDAVFGKGTITRIDAEEGRATTFKMRVAVKREALASLDASGKEPALEITMVVREG